MTGYGQNCGKKQCILNDYLFNVKFLDSFTKKTALRRGGRIEKIAKNGNMRHQFRRNW